MARAREVLPTPGTSSISRWPSASRQTSGQADHLGLAPHRLLDVVAQGLGPLDESDQALVGCLLAHGAPVVVVEVVEVVDVVVVVVGWHGSVVVVVSASVVLVVDEVDEDEVVASSSWSGRWWWSSSPAGRAWWSRWWSARWWWWWSTEDGLVVVVVVVGHSGRVVVVLGWWSGAARWWWARADWSSWACGGFLAFLGARVALRAGRWGAALALRGWWVIGALRLLGVYLSMTG